MIFLDVTKTRAAGHRSGLTRVTSRLADGLGSAAEPVVWNHGFFRASGGDSVTLSRGDWLLTAELFSEAERPGFGAFVRSRSCGLAAIFHDNIPLRLPGVTWPQSVARHPEYLKLLAGFDRVWAVSAASRDDLIGIWNWQGVPERPAVAVLVPGANATGAARVTTPPRPLPTAEILCLGILEPRKNQSFLLEICDRLWNEGADFALHLVGRINPYFGRPIRDRIRELQKFHGRLHYHGSAGDAVLRRIYSRVRAAVLPTLAEGCGLPLLEALWFGVPCVCSDLPPLRENADGGGCVTLPVGDAEAWAAALRRILTDDGWQMSLAEACRSRELPTWEGMAETLLAALGGAATVRAS